MMTLSSQVIDTNTRKPAIATIQIPLKTTDIPTFIVPSSAIAVTFPMSNDMNPRDKFKQNIFSYNFCLLYT